jgi:hypothetical protein
MAVTPTMAYTRVRVSIPLSSPILPLVVAYLIPVANAQLDEDEDGNLACQSTDANDYYGLGVRLGIYFT